MFKVISSVWVSPTCRQVLDDHSSSCVEDDVSTIVEVMQVVTTVEASVAEDVLQHQLLKTKHKQPFETKLWVRWSVMVETPTDLHHSPLLGHIVLQQFVRQRCSSTYRRSEEKVKQQFRKSVNYSVSVGLWSHSGDYQVLETGAEENQWNITDGVRESEI